MADPKITVPELGAAATLTGSELVPIWQTTGMVKATLAQVVTYAGGQIDAHIKDMSGGLVAGGTANALTVTPNRGGWALVDGASIAFRVTTLNTAAVTLNVNGTGARALTKAAGAALAAGDLAPGMIIDATYLAATSEFRLRSATILLPGITLLTSGSGVFNAAGARALRVRGVGGGGGSGGVAGTGASEAASSGAGGSGAWFEHLIVNPAGTYNWAVGAAGAAGVAGGTNPASTGGNGGDTTFGPCTAPGGKGGSAGANASSVLAYTPGAGGDLATGANILNARGNPGTFSMSGGNQQQQSLGGGTPFGGVGAVDRPFAFSTSFVGSAGTANTGAGANGSFNSPSQTSKTGAAGGSGLIIVESIFG